MWGETSLFKCNSYTGLVTGLADYLGSLWFESIFQKWWGGQKEALDNNIIFSLFPPWKTVLLYSIPTCFFILLLDHLCFVQRLRIKLLLMPFALVCPDSLAQYGLCILSKQVNVYFLFISNITSLSTVFLLSRHRKTLIHDLILSLIFSENWLILHRSLLL